MHKLHSDFPSELREYALMRKWRKKIHVLNKFFTK